MRLKAQASFCLLAERACRILLTQVVVSHESDFASIFNAGARNNSILDERMGPAVAELARLRNIRWAS